MKHDRRTTTWAVSSAALVAAVVCTGLIVLDSAYDAARPQAGTGALSAADALSAVDATRPVRLLARSAALVGAARTQSPAAAGKSATTVQQSASSVGPCRSGDLTAFQGDIAGGGMKVVDVVGIRNDGRETCTVTGYPTISATDQDGVPVAETYDYTNSAPVYSVDPPAPVTLAQGDAAGIYLGRLGAGSADLPACDPVPNAITRIGVGAEDARPLTIETDFLCDGATIYVSPLLPTQRPPN